MFPDSLSDWKAVAAIGATVLAILITLPYYWQIFKRKTTPHAYTWLIWSVTQATAAAGVWHGAGGILNTVGLLVSVAIASSVFLLSFWYGTKNITRSDTLVLVTAFFATFVWWGLDNPLLSVLMVTVIDMLGYIPTFRKSWNEPGSENLVTWIGYIVAPVLGILGLLEYNLLTTTYLAATVVANILLVLFLIVRRYQVQK